MKLKYDEALSNCACNFNVRRYSEVGWVIFDEIHYMRDPERGVVWEAGASTRPLLTSTWALFITDTEKPPNVSNEKCSSKAEKWTSVSP